MKKYKVNELEDLNKFVGTNTNINSHMNCVTRFRFNVIDKNKVDVSDIKKLSFVRGINWAGNELQVIIGPEVSQVRDQYMQIFPDTITGKKNEVQANKTLEKHKFSFKKTFMGFVSGVIIPLIPALMAAGMIQALYAILTSSGAIMSVSAKSLGQIGKTIPIMDGVMFIISDTGLKFLGFLIGFNTIRYLGGKNVNIVMAVLVPLIMSAPYLFGFGSWTLFSFGNVEGRDLGISIMSYSSMFLPQIGAAFIYVYLDKWIKTWMPGIVDIIFRHAIALLATALLGFLALGPILGLLENGIYLLFTYIQKVPYGFGLGIFGFCWTFLVLTGMHMGLAVAIINSVGEQGSQLLAFSAITSMSTIGTCVAVAIRAKEATMKKLSVGALFSGAFGVSEPTYYSISMLRPILFLPVLVARGATGMLIGLIDVRGFQPGGKGILGFTTALKPTAVSGVDPMINILKMVGAMAFLFAVCFALTMVLYKEVKTDKKMINSVYHKLFKEFKVKQNSDVYNSAKAELNNLKTEVSTKQFKDDNKATEKVIIEENNLKYKVLKIEELQDKSNDKTTKKVNRWERQIEKLEAKIEKQIKNQKQEQVQNLYQKQIEKKNKISELNKINKTKQAKFANEIEQLNQKIAKIHVNVLEALETLENKHLEIESKIKQTFNPLIDLENNEQVSKTNAMIFNSVHNLEINYKIIDKLEV